MAGSISSIALVGAAAGAISALRLKDLLHGPPDLENNFTRAIASAASPDLFRSLYLALVSRAIRQLGRGAPCRAGIRRASHPRKSADGHTRSAGWAIRFRAR